MKQLVWTTETRKVSELIPQADNYKKTIGTKKAEAHREPAEV